MKTKVMILSCLMGAIVLSMGYGYGRAESKAEELSQKIGIVSIQKIFQDCRRSARYREETAVEQNQALAGLERLSKEIEAEKVGLKAFKAGSSDHLAAVEELLKKQADFQARQEIHKQKMMAKQQIMVESLYKDILRATEAVAEEKSLALVFEKSEPELPAPSASELERAMATHKLLYSGGCLDVTEEVMARVDAMGSGK